jgi:transposase
LVDTQGLVLKTRVHGANIQDREGVKLLLEPARIGLPRLSHLWLDAGYTGQDKGAGWVESALGWSTEVVRHPPKPAPDLGRISVSPFSSSSVDKRVVSGSRPVR